MSARGTRYALEVRRTGPTRVEGLEPSLEAPHRARARINRRKIGEGSPRLASPRRWGLFQERHQRGSDLGYMTKMRSRLRIPFPTLMSVFWLYHVTEVFASECEQVAWTTSNCEVGLCDLSLIHI